VINRKTASLICLAAFCAAQLAQADFKYTETSKITGGMMAGMMKFAGAFSRKANEPTVSTVYVKGARLRRDSSDGTAQIIDLDGKRMIHIDPQKRTYSVVTFEQMRQAMQQAQEKLKQKNARINVTPKVDVTPTGGTRDILGQSTREVKVKFDMEMRAQDNSKPDAPQQAGGTMTMTSDMWLAPAVTGYEELKDFYKRMAQEINWMPNAGLFAVDPRAAKGMQELQKNSSQMQGLPMVQYVSMYMGGVPQGQASAAQSSGGQSGAQSTSNGGSSAAANETAVKALGSVLGGFGGFGRKKKKQQDQQADQSSSNAGSSATSPGAPPPQSNAGSFMDMAIEITSFSSASIDSSLFEIPAGYTQVQQDPEQMMTGRKR